ncbi:MAG: hypothetical protein H7287_02575, partial [Thermoleophilia bacterium]|nr:hypothetical protein [Thermoleophilia bacterium]
MKVFSHIAPALVVLLLVLAAVPAIAIAEVGDVGSGPLTLAPVAQEPAVVGIDDLAAGATGDGALQSDLADAVADPTLDPATAAQGTDVQLTARRAQLIVRRNAAQNRLIALEQARTTQEDLLDTVLDDYSTRLADLYDANDVDRLAALMAARKESDPATRAAVIAALAAPERILMERESTARAAVAAASTAADVQRDVV